MLKSLDHKMVASAAIVVDPMSKVVRGHFGDVRKGRLEGRPGSVAVKELRPRGDDQSRLRVEVVGRKYLNGL